jgi:hypothetical protein
VAPGQQPQPPEAAPWNHLQAVEALVIEVGQSLNLDAAGRQQLAQILVHTEPGQWPQAVQQFRAAWACGHQAALRDRVAADPARAEPQYRDLEVAPTSSATARAESPKVPDLSKSPGPPRPQTTSEEKPGERAAAKPIGAAQKRASDPANGVSGTGKDGDRVEQASYNASSTSSENWRERLAATIAAMEAETKQAPQSGTEQELQARLRLLYVVAQRRDDAARPIPSAPAATQEFWSREVYGLMTLLDAERLTDAPRRAAEAKQHLSEAKDRLGEMSPLVLRNLTFIQKVDSFGVFEPMDKCEFTPGQTTLLYAEVENFQSEESTRGFCTRFDGSYEIFDDRGNSKGQQTLKPTEDFCRNRRRDFFLAYFPHIPKTLTPGHYRLQLNITDAKSRKTASSSLDFTVK